MSAVNYSVACEKFKKKFGQPLVERVERSFSADYDKLIEADPSKVFKKMVQIVYLQYIMPYELMSSIDSMVKNDYNVLEWDIFLSKFQKLNYKEDREEILHFISAFHDMVKKLGLENSIGFESGESK